MSFIAAAAIAAGGSIVSGIMGANAASDAARAQLRGVKDSNAVQERMFNKQVELQEPFRQSGMSAQNRLMDLLGLSDRTGAADYGMDAKSFGMDQFRADPGYGFRLQEGLKALDRSAAARGGLLSGAQLRGVTEFGQNMGSQEYQNAFNRFYTERANRMNPLQSLMGAGQTSANTLTNAAGQFGTAMGNNAIAAGNARASGYVGQANAWNQAIGGVGNAAMGMANWQGQQNMLNAFRPQPSQQYVYNAIQQM